jgi:hypothetical protein
MDEQRPNGAFEGRGRPPASDPGRFGTIVFGLVLIAVGAWFFADRTLGLDLPSIDWGDLWPVVLIAIGGWVILGARSRRV